MDTRVTSFDKEAVWAEDEARSRAAEAAEAFRAKLALYGGKLAGPFAMPTRVAHTTLPDGSAERKAFPLFEGVLKYFPAALAAVAAQSVAGNTKHNGVGAPLQHSRGLSMDHGDCLLRHLMDLSEDRGHGVGYDEKGHPVVAHIAWRALALAQEWFEKNTGAPLAPNAKEAS